MIRRTIAGAAFVGALMLGTAGAAGAAGTTPSTAPASTAPASSTTTPTTTPCSEMAEMVQRYHSSEQRVAQHAHKTAALEARMRKLGHTKLAAIIGKKVRWAQNRAKRIETRLHQAVAQCAAQGHSASTGKASTSGT
jgi:hypothetical protein